MAQLSGKCALVTGASRGIGAAIALQLAAGGARVIVNYQTNRKAADAVVAAIQSSGGWAKAVQADVANIAQTRALIAGAAAEYENLGARLDILVCNAGICVPKPLAEVDEPDFDLHFATNVKAVLFGAQAAAQAFGDAGGAILIIGSLNGKRPANGASVYSAAKAAVEAITISLAQELGPRGIRINTIAPGLTDTDMVNNFYKPEDLDAAAAATALRRLGTPADIAKAAAFLVSDDAGWITGDVVTASGGLF